MRSRVLLIATVGLFAVFAAGLAADAQQSPDLRPSELRLQPRSLVESHLKSFAQRNDLREQRIREWFSDAGCNAPNLSEQAVQGTGSRGSDHGLPPNVICVLPGETDDVILVGAHTDKVAAGDGVIDNWSGAVLLPALFFTLKSALAAQPRHHTLVFIGFSAEESGLIGSRYFADHLTGAQRARIEAVINFDSLAAGRTEFWTSHTDKVLLDPLISVAAATHLPISGMDVPTGSNADSESFARYHIPRITLHSMTDQTWPILHSRLDTIEATNFDDYYDSYRLIAAYLLRLDAMLGPRNTNGQSVQSDSQRK